MTHFPEPTIYLDHSATTPPYPEVLRFYCERSLQVYANPSSVHRLGREALKGLDDARQRLARTLDCLPEEIIITSGASESINTALRNFFPPERAWAGGLAYCPGEHAATRQTAAALLRAGVHLHTIALTTTGAIDLESVAAVLAEKPLVLTYMLVNNETGAIAPSDEIRKLRDQISPRTRIHIDAVQAMGRLPLSFRSLQADLMSLSGHKFGAPRGIGLLLCRRGIGFSPLIEGGGQQNNRRSGTENPPLGGGSGHGRRTGSGGTGRAVGTDRCPGCPPAPAAVRAWNRPAARSARHLWYRISWPCACRGLRGETLVNALSAEGHHDFRRFGLFSRKRR